MSLIAHAAAAAACFLFHSAHRVAALLTQTIASVIGSAQSCSEEMWMQSSPFHNGFGMLTVHGVRKPVWQAFSLLANAGDRRLPVTGASVSPNSRASAISVLATLNSSAGSDASAGGLGLGLQHCRRPTCRR